MPLRWSGRNYQLSSTDIGISIARDLLSHSLIAHLILFGRLISAGVKPFYEGKLSLSQLKIEKRVLLDEGIIPSGNMVCDIRSNK